MKKLFRKLHATRPFSKKAQPAPKRRTRLGVEELEDRILMTLGTEPDRVLPTVPDPVDIQLIHLDGDGQVDAAVLGDNGQLTLAFNNGDNTWRSSTTLDLGIGPANGLLVASVDGDVFADLIVQGPNSITIAANDGAGGFTVTQTLTPGTPGDLAPSDGGRVGLTVAPVTSDLFADLVAVSPGTDEVLVYRGTISSLAATPDRYASGGGQPIDVLAGNFIGDELPDLAVAHRDGTITFLQGLPTGGFALRSELTISGLGTIQDVAAADFDQDGDLDLAVSGTDRVTVLSNVNDVLTTSPITNGDFSEGLTGWTTSSTVSAGGGFAQLLEGESFLTTLEQTFVVPPTPQTVSFDVISLGLEAALAGKVPDAFEVSLLDGSGNSLVPTFRADATSFFNVNPGSVVALAAGVTFDGRTVTIDISGLAPGTEARLIFDLVGNPPGTTSVASIDNVRVSPDRIFVEMFTDSSLAGPFGATAGIAAGDVDGDGHLDLVVADRGANRLLVYNGDGAGAFARNEINVAGFGTAPLAVAAGPLTAGDTVADVAVTLFGSAGLLNPLAFEAAPPDTTPPTVSFIDPAPGALVNQGVTEIRVQFSEAMRDTGPSDPHSVTNPASYVLFTNGANNVFEGGAGDDVQVPIASVGYDSGTFEAVLTIADGSSPLADEKYQLTIEGDDANLALQDLAGNLLGDGVDATSTFTVDTTPPSITLQLTPNVLWSANHQLVNVHAEIFATDAVDPQPTVTLLSITSNEPDTSATPGDLANDIQDADFGTDDRDFSLRAERLTTTANRLYTVTYWVCDAAGNSRVQAAYVVVPQDGVAGSSSIAANFNGTPISAGRTIWFNSVLKPSNLGTGPVTIRFVDQAISFSAAGTDYFLPAPDAVITYSAAVTVATTSFDAANNQWVTNLPISGLSGNQFLSGLAYQLPVDLPGGVKDVTWYGQFLTDTPGVTLNWKWGAAVYTSFSADYNALGIKPVDDNDASQYQNSDHAGTPENFKSFVIGGARGGGGSNWTGSYSGTKSNTPTTGPSLIDSLGDPTPQGLSYLQTCEPGQINDPPFNVGDVVNDSISVPGEVDVWTFQGTAGQRLFFDAQLGSSSVFHWVLTDPNSALVFNQDFRDQNTLLLSVTGQYALTVDARSGQTGSYRFQVWDVPSPGPTTISIGQVVSDTIGVPGEEDHYVFTGAAGQRLFFDVQVNPSAKFGFTLLKPDSSVLLTRNSGDRDVFTLPDSGTYTVVVGDNGVLDSTGSYQFQVWAVPDVVTVPITLGQVVPGSIDVPGEEDRYSFSGLAGQRLFFDVQVNPTSKFGFTLLRPDNSVLLTRSPSDRDVFTLPDSGTYTVVVGDNGTIDSTGSYQFQVWAVPDTITVPISVGQVVAGALAVPGEMDRYTFSGTAGQRLFFDVQNNPSLKFEFSILRPDGTTLLTPNTVDRDTFVLPAAGTYTVVVDDNSPLDATGDYQFQVWEVPADTPQAIAFTTPVPGAIDVPGQTVTYTFQATAGQQFLFDVIFNQSNRTGFTLRSPTGSTLFSNATGDRTITSLPSTGTYTLVADGATFLDSTGMYSFRLVSGTPPALPAAADLVVSDVSATARAIGNPASIVVTWTVTNVGTVDTGPAWVDRIRLSADTTLGGVEDWRVIDFAHTGILQPGQTYTRTETVVLPADLEGAVTVFVTGDVRNEVWENQAELNHTAAALPTAIYRAPTPATPLPSVSLDQADGSRFPAGSTVTVSGQAAVPPGSLNVVFVVDVSNVTDDVTGLDANFDGLFDAADNLNGDSRVGDLLDLQIGAVLQLHERLADRAGPVSLGLVLMGSSAQAADLGAGFFNQVFVHPLDDANLDPTPDFEEAIRSLFVTGITEFRSITVGGGASYTAALQAVNQLLDRAPDADQTAVVFLTANGTSTLPDADVQELAARGIAFHGLQVTGTAVDTGLADLAERIDADASSTGDARLLNDAGDLSFSLPALAITQVTVNGQPATLDGAGQFFQPVTVVAGPNLVTAVASDTLGRTGSASITLVGADPAGPIDFDNLQDVTVLAQLDYRGTFYNRSTRTLHAEVQLTNLGSDPLPGLVLEVFDRFTPPSVSLSNPDDFHPDGRPFVTFDSELPATGLAPGATSDPIALAFANPTETRFSFDVTLLAPANGQPFFGSAPVTSVVAGAAYTYQASASDPDGDRLTYRLDLAPEGMTIDPDTGRIDWAPALGQAGTHAIQLTVTDGRGGSSTQSYFLRVFDVVTNRPPILLSEPPLTALVGKTYTYTVDAVDPDGDALSFSLVAAPAGVSINSVTGALTWTPGTADQGLRGITVRVDDGQGGSVTQSFILQVVNVAPATVTGLKFDDVNGNGVRDFFGLFEQNLIVNGNAEAGAGSPTGDDVIRPIPGWTPTGNFTVVRYGAVSFSGAFPTPTDPGPADRGLNFFAGGPNNFASSATQTADVSAEAATIDAGVVTFTLSGYLGGFAAQDDYAVLTAVFKDALGLPLGGAAIGPVTRPERADQTGLLYRATAGAIPAGTRLVELVLDMSRFQGTYNDGYADNLSLTLHSPGTEAGLPGWTVYVDRNSNGSRDADEPFTVTDADGAYSLTDLTPATHVVAEERQAGWVQTAPASGSYTVTLSAGQLLTGLFFGNHQVPPGDHAPVFTSAPLTDAAVGQVYRYQATAFDEDGDLLTFELLSGPAGMVVQPLTGAVVWQPTADQAGTQPVVLRVLDGQGGLDLQAFDVTVTADVSNPVITSTPAFLASVGEAATYQVVAFDPAGQELTFALAAAPAGMAIDADGLITWTPAEADLGPHRISITVTNEAGAVGRQTYDLTVRPANEAPTVSSSPITTVTAGTDYRYRVEASDSADAVTFTMVAAPAGMTIDPRTGVILWNPEAGDIGDHAVTVRVLDERGAFTDQPFTLTVAADTEPPAVSMLVSQSFVNPGETVAIRVVASDNVAVASIALTINGDLVTLDSGGNTQFTPATGGFVQLVATALDTSGNLGSATDTIRVFDPTDTEAPFLEITSPVTGDVITYLTDVIGTVTDANLEFYRLEYARLGTGEFRTFAEGTTSVVNGFLGTFDPTLLLNDDYAIRIVAQDVNGLISISPEVVIGLTANAKLGNFRLEFTDLQIPVTGIPITITRIYDTLQASESGDFGFGWTLGAQDARIRETVPVNPLEQFVGLFAACGFRQGTRVYLTNPEGRRVGFTFEPTRQDFVSTPQGPMPPPFGPIYHPYFRPDPGVFDTLAVDDIPLSLRQDGTFGLYLFSVPWNPSEYTLTTKDGIQYRYNQFTGLETITDRNANVLTFTDAGIFSSSGESIQFVRDAEGRITEIVDPAGNSLTYQYDAAGDLRSVTDQEGNTSQYEYLTEPPHYLAAAIDPLGRQAIGATYDAENRLSGVSNALGDTTGQTYDLENFTEFVADPEGSLTRLVYDARGNIVEQADPLGNTWVATYDVNDNLTASTDPRGFTTFQTFDTRGNVASVTDALNQTWEFTYNSFSKPLTATDPLGRTVQYVYDSNGNLTQLVNAAGVSSFIEYDPAGRVIAYTDNSGNTTVFVYGAGPNPIQVSYADGATQHAEYNIFSELTRLLDANGNETLVSYDRTGRPLSVRDPLGNSVFYAYNGHLLQTQTDRLGRSIEYEYDAASRLIRRSNPHHHTPNCNCGDDSAVEYVYNGRNQVISEADALGRITQYVYRADGKLSQTINALGGITSYDYDPAGNQTVIVDANGHQTTFEYDARNRVIKRTNALGGIQLFTYDAVGNQTSWTDENGHSMTYAYDLLNRLVQQVNALGGIESRAYDPRGNLTSFTDANGHASSFQYNSRNWLVTITDPAGGTRQFAYDGMGKRVSTTDELGNITVYVLDPLSRVVQVVDPFGAVTEFGYDAEGNRTSVRDPLGRTTAYSFDDLDRIVSMTDPRGSVTQFTYDLVGNRTSVTDPVGNTTAFAFDLLNRMIEETDPLGRSRLFVYDAVGNLTEATDRNGRVRSFAYDALDRQVQETWWNGASPVYVGQFTYDPVGNLLSASDPNSTYTLTYDALNRVQAIDNSGTPGVPSIILTYGYDPVGNVLSIGDNLGAQVGSVYDERNLLTSRTWSGGGVDPVRIDFTYNLRGDRVLTERFTDLAGTQQVGTSAAGFDAVGRMTHLEHRDALDAIFANYDYFFDPAGQLAQEIINGQSSTYSHDAAGQLTGADHAAQPDEGYTYDANGNRIMGAYVVGPNNQVLSDGVFNYAYDNEGNLVQKTEIATGQVTTYSWDHRNRLVAVETRDAFGGLIQQVSFTYDVFDRRIAKTVNGQTMYTVYENNRIPMPNQFSPCERNSTLSRVWADFDEAGQVSARYLAGARPDELLARHRAGEGTAFYLADRLGTVRDLADRAGVPTNHITYDSFGRILVQSNAAFGDRFLFTGREFDFEIGLYYYRARYYDPALGRFISQDPIGLAGGDPNFYRYVHNMPTNKVDPSGLLAISVGAFLERAVTVEGVLVAVLVAGTFTWYVQHTPAPRLPHITFDFSFVLEAISWAGSTLGRYGEATFLAVAVGIEVMIDKASAEEAADAIRKAVITTATAVAVAEVTFGECDCWCISFDEPPNNIGRMSRYECWASAFPPDPEAPEVCDCGFGWWN